MLSQTSGHLENKFNSCAAPYFNSPFYFAKIVNDYSGSFLNPHFGERGAIIFTASVAAQDAQIGQVIYGSAKAGVNGLVLPMARDLMDLGIRVNSIMPGVFGTPLLGNMNPKVKESLEASVPFPKRLGKAEEYASLAMEMIRNTYFNGQAVRLDGAIRMAPR